MHSSDVNVVAWLINTKPHVNGANGSFLGKDLVRLTNVLSRRKLERVGVAWNKNFADFERFGQFYTRF